MSERRILSRQDILDQMKKPETSDEVQPDMLEELGLLAEGTPRPQMIRQRQIESSQRRNNQ